jgi:hypothetical protein
MNIEVSPSPKTVASIRYLAAGDVGVCESGRYPGWLVMATVSGVFFVNDGDFWPWSKVLNSTLAGTVRVLPKGTKITITL